MRFLKQFLIILVISIIGEILSHFIPAPIPASIYGLILMFLALKFKIFPLSSVKETGKFLVDLMPITFIGPGVAIIESMDVLKAYWWQIILITVLSTFVVMIVTGFVSQTIMKLLHKKEEK